MPRTEAELKRRAEKRRKQRARRKAEGPKQDLAGVTENLPLPEVPTQAPQPPAEAKERDYFNNEIVAALGQLAGAVAELNQRIATIEEAQARGLETLATQSGLGMLGLSGMVPGEQAALIQSSSYRAQRETEAQILAEESYNLPIPNDGHVIVVGATNEEMVRARREAFQKSINEQHGGFIR